MLQHSTVEPEEVIPIGISRTIGCHRSTEAGETMECKKILLVDDSSTVLMLEKMILGSDPYDLQVAKDGQEALEVAASQRPDLILMDVVMPVMDGFEACRQLRASEAARTVPIIMVTTRGQQEHVETGFKSGCTDYITKPINGLDLLAKVRTHLSA